MCQSLGAMGEDTGRFFMKQMVDVLQFIHGKGVVHRDLKLENILIDDNMNLKVADFGFASFTNIKNLNSYRGTKTYMAPEVKLRKEYNGTQIDVFSTAVILFIIVMGIFPFKEAKKTEYFYGMIFNGELDKYWNKTGGDSLSSDFKDLIVKMLSFEGEDRPTLDDIKNHPWMQVPIDDNAIRISLINKLKEKT